VSRLFGRPTIQFELVLNLTGVVTAGLATIAVICVGLAVRTVEQEALDRLHLTAVHLQRTAASSSSRLSDLGALSRTFDAGPSAGTWRVLDRRGRDIWRGPRSSGPDEAASLAREAWAGGLAVEGGLIPFTDLRVALPVRTSRGEEGTLIGTVTVQHLWGRVRPLVGSASWVLVITAVVFISFGAYLLRRRIVMPVREIAGASADIAEGRLSTRLEIPGAHELANLGHHFNQMAESLERQREALVAAERSLARSERLASVGRLAAGVAHEVGNPVAAILGFGEVALRDPKLSERTREAMNSVKGEALRIRALIRELLDLARSDEPRLENHDLKPLLIPIVDRMRGQPAHGEVEIGLELSDDLPSVRTDARRVEQVLANLIENAIHATGDLEHGMIEISARTVPDERGTVAIDVVDNGPGIPAENLGRVFDPFFTTKEPGAGTGLGLWNSHRWAELLGGGLEVASSPGRTRFSLLLPAADTAGWDGAAASTDC
jgi:signal transduction histidine kinase